MTIYELQERLPALKHMSLEQNLFALTAMNEYGLDVFIAECMSVMIERENRKLDDANHPLDKS